ncbi:MAG: hypothetical protein SVY53_04070 [Chloroflexota bacterium]|nr:hypothetical protein [Chloroflexota bacterium]
MASLILEYLLFVFAAACGIIQLSALYGGLKGLLFFHNNLVTIIVSLAAILISYGLFFGWDTRMDEYIMHTGLEGAQQLYFSTLGILIAVIFTVLLSSILNRHCAFTKLPTNEDEDGIEQLRHGTYYQAIKRSLTSKQRKE